MVCSKGHELVGSNLIIEGKALNKRCRVCKNAYEAKRKRFQRANPGQPFDPNWAPPKYRKCKKGLHPMTPANTRVVGKGLRPTRCNKCYKKYRRDYQRQWQTYKIYT